MMKPPLRYLCPRVSMLYLGMTLILSPRVCLTLSQKVAMSSLFLIVLREARGTTGITTSTLLKASTLNTIPLTHTSPPKVVSHAADEQGSRRWEDQQLAADVLRRLRDERAELGRLRSVCDSLESHQAGQTEGAARDLSSVEERLRKIFSELVPDDDTVMDKGNVRAQGVLRRMQHQHWGLQAACWPARISGVSTRSTTRENGISSEATGEAHQVSQGHM